MPHIHKKKEQKEMLRPGMVAHTYNPSYLGGTGRRTEAQDWPQVKM
jgi:hypothetical protein